jgi:transposase-like protein
MEAYVAGVSTRSVDDLVAALGIGSGISKSEVRRICAGLDEIVTAFRTRRLDHAASRTSTSTRPTSTCATPPRKSCPWP